MISAAENSNTSAGSREMMSSICQAMTSVSGGVAAFTAENDVAIVVVAAAARGEFRKAFHLVASLPPSRGCARADEPLQWQAGRRAVGFPEPERAQQMRSGLGRLRNRVPGLLRLESRLGLPGRLWQRLADSPRTGPVADEPSNQANAMWGGRFSASPSALMEAINASIGFDRRLARQDIEGEPRPCRDAGPAGIIADSDRDAIHGRPAHRSWPRSRPAPSRSRRRSRTST